jgi:uncharacterized protein YndB with AHSA1/START domain
MPHAGQVSSVAGAAFTAQTNRSMGGRTMTPLEAGPSGTDLDPAAARTLATSRLVAARPEQVYAAIVSPERLARWWGPKGFRNTFQVFEPRPGGSWRFVMHGPNGADYPNDSVFEALVPAERVVIRHLSRPRFVLTVALAAEGAGTRLTWRQAFDSAADCEAVRHVVVQANEENLDRLEAELGGART